jgi:3',5'-cyclic AMP phosphodiesterase CpdA
MRRPLPLLLAVALLCPAATLHAQRYTFVVTGDGRAGVPARPGMDDQGINATVMRELVREILRIDPKFVLFTGDLVHGHTDAATFRAQLEAWLEVMKPVYAAGIHVYPVRGNHDAYESGHHANPDIDRAWDQVFSGPYALPDDGPDGEKNMTFAAKEENALILGLDEWGDHAHAVNLAWLHTQLDHNTQPLIFAEGHEMAFRSGHHEDNLDNRPAERDEFIEALRKAGGLVYFAGHDHLYDRADVAGPYDTVAPKFEQIVVGTAGAPFAQGHDFDGANGAWTVTHPTHVEMTYGYVLGEVDGTKVSLFFMGRLAPGVYEPLDTYSYTAGTGGTRQPRGDD